MTFNPDLSLVDDCERTPEQLAIEEVFLKLLKTK